MRFSLSLNVTPEQEKLAAESRQRRLSQPSSTIEEARTQVQASLSGKTVPVKGYSKFDGLPKPQPTPLSKASS